MAGRWQHYTARRKCGTVGKQQVPFGRLRQALTGLSARFGMTIFSVSTRGGQFTKSPPFDAAQGKLLAKDARNGAPAEKLCPSRSTSRGKSKAADEVPAPHDQNQDQVKGDGQSLPRLPKGVSAPHGQDRRRSVEESRALCFVSNLRLERVRVCHHLFAGNRDLAWLNQFC